MRKSSRLPLVVGPGTCRGAAGPSQGGPWGPSPEVAARLDKCSSGWRTEPPGNPAFLSRGTARCLLGGRVFSVSRYGDTRKEGRQGSKGASWRRAAG